MKHTTADIEKIATALSKLRPILSEKVVWKDQNAAYKKLASLTSQSFVDELAAEQDSWRRNVKLRFELSEFWNELVARDQLNDALEITRWKVSDWGGIRNISDATIREHFNDAFYKKTFLPFDHISSKSKALTLLDPSTLQIYDARVAVSLNTMQLLADTEVRLYFKIPETTIKMIQHDKDCFHARLPEAAFNEFDFVSLPLENIYTTYTRLLLKLAVEMQLNVIDVEMMLFGLSPYFTEELGVLSNIIGEERVRRREKNGLV